MIIEKEKIIMENAEDKQLLYDALVQYMFSEYKLGQSKHFAADIHSKISIEASNALKKMREEWDSIVH